MTSNKNESNLSQPQSNPNATKSASSQFGLSIAIGVLTIIIAVAALYFGLFPNYK